MNYRILGLLLVPLFGLSCPASGQESSALFLKTHIPLPNVNGRIDHLGVDVKGQRLFVAAVDNHTLEVVDLKSGQRIHTITDLAEPQGVFYDVSTNRLFVASAVDGVVKIYDGATFQVLATAKFPDDSDNIRHDPRGKRVIVGYAGAKQLRKRAEGNGGLGFLDSDGNKTGDVVIDAHPESFRLEGSGNRIFVDRDHIHYDRIAHYATPLHTQTGLFVPEWGELFAAAQGQGEQSAEIRVYEANGGAVAQCS